MRVQIVNNGMQEMIYFCPYFTFS